MTMAILSEEQEKLVFRGGGHYQGERWWSDYFKGWYPVDFDPAGYAEVRAVQVGTKWGRSFGLGLMMQSGMVKKYQFQLVARSGEATWVDEATDFLLLYRGGPETVTEDRSTRQALDALHYKVIATGWIPLQQTGFEWYSYTYYHPSFVKGE